MTMNHVKGIPSLCMLLLVLNFYNKNVLRAEESDVTLLDSEIYLDKNPNHKCSRALT